MRRARTSTLLPLYVGGFLGPFGGGVLAVLVPQLRDAFDATTGAVAAAIPAYLVPVRGVPARVGHGRRAPRPPAGRPHRLRRLRAVLGRWPRSRRRSALFLVARALQGAANAFLTPLLLAGLADDVAARGRSGARSGRSPRCRPRRSRCRRCAAALLGAIDWRLVFWLQAVVALGLRRCRRPTPSARSTREPARLRSVLTRARRAC